MYFCALCYHQVKVGDNYVFQAGYLEYPDPNSLLVPIVTSTVAFFLFVAVLTVVICYCNKRKRELKAQNRAKAKSLGLFQNGHHHQQQQQRSRRKNSSANPLYTPAEEDDGNYNPVFVTVNDNNNSLTSQQQQQQRPTSTHLRHNSIYDVTSSTQVRLPSGSSDTSDEFAAILMNGARQNGRFSGHVLQSIPFRQARKSSGAGGGASSAKTKSKRLGSSDRKKGRGGSGKKTNLAPIRETKQSKRFRRQDSNTSSNGLVVSNGNAHVVSNGNAHVVSNGYIQTGDIAHEYIRPIFLTDGTTHSHEMTEMDSLRVRTDRRDNKSPPYSIT